MPPALPHNAATGVLQPVLQASNEALAAEKTRMDVLLARQYNLISCMAEQGMSNGNGSGKRGNSLEEKTLGEFVHFCGNAC